jgi:hypothetical protein
MPIIENENRDLDRRHPMLSFRTVPHLSYRLKTVRPLSQTHLETVRARVAATSCQAMARQLKTSPLTLSVLLSGAFMKPSTVIRIERAIDALSKNIAMAS